MQPLSAKLRYRAIPGKAHQRQRSVRVHHRGRQGRSEMRPLVVAEYRRESRLRLVVGAQLGHRHHHSSRNLHQREPDNAHGTRQHDNQFSASGLEGYKSDRYLARCTICVYHITDGSGTFRRLRAREEKLRERTRQKKNANIQFELLIFRYFYEDAS